MYKMERMLQTSGGGGRGYCVGCSRRNVTLSSTLNIKYIALP